jgi:hypothetical protein
MKNTNINKYILNISNFLMFRTLRYFIQNKKDILNEKENKYYILKCSVSPNIMINYIKNNNGIPLPTHPYHVVDQSP